MSVALSDFGLHFSHLRDIGSLMQIKNCQRQSRGNVIFPKGKGHALDRGRGLQELAGRTTAGTSLTS